jgi:phospholipase C
MGALNEINHIVVLMLEYRSFDNLLGGLGQFYPPAMNFNGLTGNETNPNPPGPPVQVRSNVGTDRATMTIPDPDPGEEWTDINQQICDSQTYSPPPAGSQMSGFVANYVYQGTLPDNAGKHYVARDIMHYFTPDQVPVLSTLARSFAVSDAWYASAPCQTWPNRFFVHCATANGYENNEPVHFPYEMETIYDRLEKAGQPWKIYFTDFPQSLTLSNLWTHLDHFDLYDHLKSDVAADKLPAYSFIEPRYFPDFKLPNDEHPPHDVRLGEQLIYEIYKCLRDGPRWNETLLVITCDEHGGCYDHVLPPAAPPPAPPRPGQAFAFDRFGVRVPAVLVSPYISAGTILRAPPGSQPFDHTAIIKTLRDRFNLGLPLTQRDVNAPSLDQALTLATPSNQGPDPASIPVSPYTPTFPEIARAQLDDLNDFQHSLMVAAAHLPTDAATAAVAAHIAGLKTGLLTQSVDDIEAHVAKLGTALGGADGSDGVAREDARHFVKQRLNQLFGSL